MGPRAARYAGGARHPERWKMPNIQSGVTLWGDLPQERLQSFSRRRVYSYIHIVIVSDIVSLRGIMRQAAMKNRISGAKRPFRKDIPPDQSIN
jgi:hypothetical protein